MSKQDEKIVYLVYETKLHSIVNDVGIFGTLIASFWATYKFAGGSIILQIILAFCFFIAISLRSGGKFKRMTIDEAKEYFCKGENG